MKVVTKEICAHASTMAVIYSKEAALGPICIRVFFVFRLHYIQDDGYSILVVVSKSLNMFGLTFKFPGSCLRRTQ